MCNVYSNFFGMLMFDDDFGYVCTSDYARSKSH